MKSRWTEKGMNNKDPKIFGEYNTMDANGNNITPESNKITSFGGTFETILTAEQAAEYTYAKMFKDNADNQWDPAALTAQAAAPTNVKLNGTTLTWDAGKDAIAWFVTKNDQIYAFNNQPELTVDDANATYAVRAANQMGGLGEAALTPTIVTTSKTGYATFYDSQKSYVLPKDLKAYVVTEGTTDRLTYEAIGDIIPANTAVMLKADKKMAAKYELTPTNVEANYAGSNLLLGSDEATTTYSNRNEYCLFYKLAFGHSNTPNAIIFGWWWGANDGAPFEIEGHKAWLAIPKAIAAARMYPIVSEEATGIDLPSADDNDGEELYNLNGQRIQAPTKGLYIRNNKKVIIK